MVLTSRLLSADKKLEAAAVSDAAHIKVGASGEHVRKIQIALRLLDQAKLALDGQYGRQTAAAVQHYKQARGIVNRQYQTSADDIVGKMTITRLDRELAAMDNLPSTLLAVNPAPVATGTVRVAAAPGPRLAFALQDADRAGTVGDGGLAPALLELIPTSPGAQVVIAPHRIGLVQPVNFGGGVLVLSEPPNPNTSGPRIAKLISGTHLRSSGRLDNADIVASPEVFRYQTFLECGVFKMQAIGPGTKKSAVSDFFVLVDKSSYTEQAVHPVDAAFKSSMVSTEGTPLRPLPGKKINIFGRGESNGFENYSSSIPFCNDSGPNTKPWTDDPRKPAVGIVAKSVMNICIRSSPIAQVTIDEIKRIAAPGCRVTFSGPAGEERFMQLMKKEFLDSGLSKSPPIEDGTGKFGRSLVFEFR